MDAIKLQNFVWLSKFFTIYQLGDMIKIENLSIMICLAILEQVALSKSSLILKIQK
jgi:hypothetical protein